MGEEEEEGPFKCRQGGREGTQARARSTTTLLIMDSLLLSPTLDRSLLREGKARFPSYCASNSLIPIWAGLFDDDKNRGNLTWLEVRAMENAQQDGYKMRFAEYLKEAGASEGILANLPDRAAASMFALSVNFSLPREKAEELYGKRADTDDATVRETVEVKGKENSNGAPSQKALVLLQTSRSSIAREDIYSLLLVCALPPTPVELASMLEDAVWTSNDFATRVFLRPEEGADASVVPCGRLDMQYCTRLMLDPWGEHCFSFGRMDTSSNWMPAPFQDVASFANSVSNSADKFALLQSRKIMADLLLDLSRLGERGFWNAWANGHIMTMATATSIDCPCPFCKVFVACVLETVPQFRRKPEKIDPQVIMSSCDKAWV